MIEHRQVKCRSPSQLVRSCQIVLAILHGDVTNAEAEVLKDDVELFNV